MEKFPVGTTWEAISPVDGKIGHIWLERRDGDYEVWMWRVSWPDGSAPFPSSNWGPSYASCRQEIPLSGKVRFKRTI